MTRKFSFVSVAALAALPIPFACGGDDGGAHIVTHDASMAVDAPAPCLAADMYAPTFNGSADQHVSDHPQTGSGSDVNPHHMYFTGELNTETAPDELWIDLWAQYGGFGSGDIKTGTYTIDGDEKAFSTCGICVYVAAQVDADNGPSAYYWAQGGVVTLTSVMGKLTGTLTNITLAQVGIDPDGFPLDEVEGNCASKIDSASFDVDITAAGSGSATGKVRLHLQHPNKLRHRFY